MFYRQQRTNLNFQNILNTNMKKNTEQNTAIFFISNVIKDRGIIVIRRSQIQAYNTNYFTECFSADETENPDKNIFFLQVIKNILFKGSDGVRCFPKLFTENTQYQSGLIVEITSLYLYSIQKTKPDQNQNKQQVSLSVKLRNSSERKNTPHLLYSTYVGCKAHHIYCTLHVHCTVQYVGCKLHRIYCTVCAL